METKMLFGFLQDQPSPVCLARTQALGLDTLSRIDAVLCISTALVGSTAKATNQV